MGNKEYYLNIVEKYQTEKRNLDPKIWGKHFWNVIHSYAAEFPENPMLEDKIEAKEFYMLFIKKLPCKVCGDSYAIFIRNMPIDYYLDSRESLMFWTYKLHCMVNAKLRAHNQPKRPDPTWAEFCKKYNFMCF